MKTDKAGEEIDLSSTDIVSISFQNGMEGGETFKIGSDSSSGTERSCDIEEADGDSEQVEDPKTEDPKTCLLDKAGDEEARKKSLSEKPEKEENFFDIIELLEHI